MGLRELFASKTLNLPAPRPQELLSIAEAMFQRGLPASIEAAIQKTIDASQYYQVYESLDDQGNYFGTEFNIRATAARIKRLYALEPWINATSSYIAKKLAPLPFGVRNKQTKEVLENHPLKVKIDLGSRACDNLSMKWSGFLDFSLGGNFFEVFNDTFSELMHVPIERAALEINPITRQIDYLVVTASNGTNKTKIPWKQVIHHKYPNPYYPYYGMSIFTAAARPILLDRYKNEFEMAFYLRGATSAGVIETTEDISKTRMERLMNTFEQVYTGKSNWWRTIFLPKGAKWVKSGLTMSEMQHLEGLRENRLTILAVMGIPPSQVGIANDVNRSTAEVQERAAWENTLCPFAEFYASGWNNSYLVKTIYGDSVEVFPDYSGVQALQGSLVSKGEDAKGMQPYFFIDEIRKNVFGAEPLPDGKGERFVSEVGGGGGFGQFGLAAPKEEPQGNENGGGAPKEGQGSGKKQTAVDSQERIEKRLADGFMGGYRFYLEKLLDFTAEALRSSGDVLGYLKDNERKLAEVYMNEVEPILESALSRGQAFAFNQSKFFARQFIKARLKKYDEVDEQAIGVLRDGQRGAQLNILKQRAIESFIGFNETRTQEILGLIADEIAGGENLEAIAGKIRELYGETYKNQAFTVARSELLTAVSQGIKWNHDILGEVFSEVKKQWFHVGDSGSNPDARQNHAGFEAEGPVASDHKWGGILEYPRDTSAPAEEVINCRCTMVSVIPEDASSNAAAILRG